MSIFLVFDTSGDMNWTERWKVHPSPSPPHPHGCHGCHREVTA